MMKKALTFSICLLFSFNGIAQTSLEEIAACFDKAGGVYYAYPTPQEKSEISVPKGYKPFYVSHFGRHGSRYLIGDRDYKWVLDLLKEAKAQHSLTTQGEETLSKLEKIWPMVEDRGGDLSPVGERQQKEIATRLYNAYPEIFQGRKKISARTTMSHRCAMSMVCFGDQLKSFNPKLQIRYETSEKYVRYLNFHSYISNEFTDEKTGPWCIEYEKFRDNHTRPDRLMKQLFSKEEFVTKRVNPDKLMWGLYWIAVNMQDIETDIRFYDLFTAQEIFDLWQCINYHFYVRNANHAEGRTLVKNNARPLVRNIIESAEEAIRKSDVAATIRFGHDGNLMPLLALLQVENFGIAVSDPYEVYKVWTDFKVSPMGANLQLLFFKNKHNDIIVRFRHNERDVHIPVKTDNFPFYSWSHVKEYMESLL